MASRRPGRPVSRLAACGSLRQFAGATGLTPHAYLIQRRIEAARALLARGAALADAAAASGFADQSHMTRIFIRTYLALAMLLVGSTVVASKIAAGALPPFNTRPWPCSARLVRFRCCRRAARPAPCVPGSRRGDPSCRDWPAPPGARPC
ncbi:helix-turn-helix domain-containing protein [Massilia phosphatilytica]